MQEILDLVLHLDKHLPHWLHMLGPWLYIVLFAIIFCETGLVITPVLPGDSLLFAVGAAASLGGALNLPLVAVLLVAAAIAGDAVNYLIGSYIGPRIFTSERSWLFNKKHLLEAHAFYERYGGKTIVLARFIPIIRTFAPFVAGIGKMEYHRFAIYNVTGGLVWVLVFLLAGYYFGNIQLVQENFYIIIALILGISVLPAVIEYIRARRRPALEAEAPAAVSD
jgi:membrane-associated protein